MKKSYYESCASNLRLVGPRFGILLTLTMFVIGGCQSESRVFYEGERCGKIISNAEFTLSTPAELIKAGYRMIGTFKSEPTIHGQTVSKQEFEKNPQKVLDSIAPENAETLKSYYESLDKEVRRKAAEIGGQVVRLEKVERTYPTFRPDIAELVEKAIASDLVVKNVTSIKYWSVWRHENITH